MLLDKCWPDNWPPFQPPKVTCFQGCLRPGASLLPTQEAMKSSRCLGSGEPQSQATSTHPSTSQISHQDHKLPGWSCLLYLGRCLGLHTHSLSLFFFLSPVLLPAVLISSKFHFSVCFSLSVPYIRVFFYQVLGDSFLFLVHFFFFNFSF